MSIFDLHTRKDKYELKDKYAPKVLTAILYVGRDSTLYSIQMMLLLYYRRTMYAFIALQSDM
jgi:hypothetical protein